MDNKRMYSISLEQIQQRDVLREAFTASRKRLHMFQVKIDDEMLPTYCQRDQYGNMWTVYTIDRTKAFQKRIDQLE